MQTLQSLITQKMQPLHHLTTQLDASRYFALERNIVTYKQIEEEFRKGKIKLAIVFPQHFGEDLQHFNKAQVQLIAMQPIQTLQPSLPITQQQLLMIIRIG
jgi:hypothetical protein